MSAVEPVPPTVQTAPAGSPTIPEHPILRLSVEQYDRMVREGILTPDDRVELLEGWLVEQVSESPEHAYVLNVLAQSFIRRLPEAWYVRPQHPAATADSRPEPDIAVARGPATQYRNRHPRPDELALVVEIADTSLRKDRGVKKRVYARAAIPVYWIVNLRQRRIEVFTQPTGATSRPDYGRREEYAGAQEVPVVLDAVEVVRIPVAELLP